MLHGYNTGVMWAIQMLELTEQPPRFRDAYFDWADEAQTTPVVVILTRTGGGNREEYAEENGRMREIAGFISDRDDEFDSTFALFTYAVPARFTQAAKTILGQLGKPLTLREKTDAAVKRLGEDFPKRS